MSKLNATLVLILLSGSMSSLTALAHHKWGLVECYSIPAYYVCSARTTSGGASPITYEWSEGIDFWGNWDSAETPWHWNTYVCTVQGTGMGMGKVHDLYSSVVGSPQLDGHGCFECSFDQGGGGPL